MSLPSLGSGLTPGSTLGVMGGGQLGRMFAQAAQSMGYRVAVLDPDADGPASQVAQEQLAFAYDDAQGLAQLAQRCAAITTEFENVPATSLRLLARQRWVAPAAEAVAICQDRLMEKALFERAGVPCAAHAAITRLADAQAVAAHLLPGVLKTNRLGYDGKGQARCANRAAMAQAWQALGGVSCVLEQWQALHLELSVIVARSADGASVCLPPQQNLHRQGILAVTQVPAPDVDAATAQQAEQAAMGIAQALNYVGVLCVEFFVLQDGRLLANEMAPRPHNSGHYSIDACDISQFDLQVRALAGLPLVTPRLHSAAVMLNLLGDLWFDAASHAHQEPPWAAVLALPGVHLHLYGKAQARPGRKMGHLTVTAADGVTARQVALQASAVLGLAPF